MSRRSRHIQFGCGFAAGPTWLNFDSSPTLRVERLLLLGRLLGPLSGNAQRFPDSVLYGDITKGLPVEPGSACAVYASHVLEHLALEDCRSALRNVLLLLEPGGVFRLVVPDLEARARLYLKEISEGARDPSSSFMRATVLGLERRPRGLLGHLRSLIGGSAHLWMWDEPSMRAELKSAGFEDIRRCDFGDSDDPLFAEVEDRGRFYDSSLGIRELAMSARKPISRL